EPDPLRGDDGADHADAHRRALRGDVGGRQHSPGRRPRRPPAPPRRARGGRLGPRPVTLAPLGRPCRQFPHTDRKRGAMTLTGLDEELCSQSRWDFSDLSAVYINCTLKRSPELSHTQGLGDRSIAIMERNGVAVESIRAVDHEIAPGVYPD